MSEARPVTEVVAALIWDGDRFLICQRPANKARGLLWEFVGGKVEPGESPQQALARECREELGIGLSVGRAFLDVTHEYPDIRIHMTLYNATIAEGAPQKLEHNDIRWITRDEIGRYEFCPADEAILKSLMSLRFHHKLVRDKIPEIIEASGKACVCETLDDESYALMLNEKLLEETREYLQSGSIEELADLCEVVHAILDNRGVTPAGFERVRLDKRNERGGFSKRLLLRGVAER